MAIIYQNYRIMLFAILLQVACCAGCNAQTASELVNTKWVWERQRGDEIMEFSRYSVRFSCYNVYTKRTITYSKPYYLSDTKTGPFDFDKVGKNTSGSFLHFWNQKLHENEYCEITELTDNTLVLFFEARPNHIGSEDTYVTYKRIK